jgi:cytochrome c2
MMRKKQLFASLLTGTLIIASTPSFAKNDSQAARDISQIEVDEEKLRQAIASRTLTWLTGSSSNNDYVSVGRLANFFGFVALRVSSNHSLSRSAVAKETLHVLNKRQQNELVSLVEEQKVAFQNVQTARFDMNRALEGLLVGEEISREDFLMLGERYGAAEAELGRVIGQRLGEVGTSLTAAQKTKLSNIREQYVSGNASKTKIKGIKTKLSKADKKELINLGARLLSWTTGNESFNDFEVVGKPSQHFGFVSLRIESNHGVKRGAVANEVLDLLSADQKTPIDRSTHYNIDAFDEFMTLRKSLMRTLEVALDGKVINHEDVLEIGSKMGRKEADMTWSQAMAMLEVRDNMTDAQRTALLDLRSKYTGKSSKQPDDLFSRGRQLYAQCTLCHSENGASVGPTLTNLINRDVASDSDYTNYSSAIKNFSIQNPVWSEALLDEFLRAPKETMPGTYMGYNGLEDKGDRKALLLYLKGKR